MALQGERKQVTVLFADVRGSMEILADRDPEEARAILSPVVQHMMEAVHHYEGTVNQAAGDGIMALFGAPLAHEDHAVRACHAALRLQNRMKRHSEEVVRTYNVNLQIRVGLNSGEVVLGTVGSDLRVDYTAVGRTTHLAARMEQVATPGSILMASSTFKLAQAFVTVKPLGLIPVRGLATPVEVYELLGTTTPRHHFEMSVGRRTSQFVGRERELALLQQSLERTAAGEYRQVVVMADPGIGKSRLCFEFMTWCRSRGVPVLAGRAFGHSRATPYAPAIDTLKAYFGIAQNDSRKRARDIVTKRLTQIDRTLGMSTAIIVDILGLSESAEQPKLDPVVRREKIRGFFQTLMRAIASRRRGPGVIFLEDLHWLDEGSESLFDAFVAATRGMRTLVVANCRPGHSATWMDGPSCEVIRLAPLPSADADSLSRSLLGDDASVAPLLPLIADRARGNPLFIEELVRQFEESGQLGGQRGAYLLQRPLDIHLVPDTVQAIIATRIDNRPEAERAILQAGAAIGREFELGILSRVAEKPEVEVVDMLRNLTEVGLIHQLDRAEPTFSFAHPMMQEVTYNSMLSPHRCMLHRAIASEFETAWLDLDGAKASLIAYHWEKADNPARAAIYYAKAAHWFGTRELMDTRQWDRVRDPSRALQAWKRTYDLIRTQPRDDEARAVLLEAAGHIVILGEREKLPVSELEAYYMELMAYIELTATIPRTLRDKQMMTTVVSSYGRTLLRSRSAGDYVALATKMLSFFDSPQDSGFAIVATAMRCHGYRLTGDLQAALADNDFAMANLSRISERDQRVDGLDSGNMIKVMRGQILMLMGRYAEASAVLAELIADDSTSGSISRRAMAHATMTDIAYGLGDNALAAKHSAAALHLTQRMRVPYFTVYNHIYVGLERSMRADCVGAIDAFESAVRSCRQAEEALEAEALFLGHLAHEQMRAGQIDLAMATAREASDVARRRGNKIWQAYAEWIMGGPDAPEFLRLVKETKARHLMQFRHPRHR
ncbi:MAG: adenylate/guanylate cyclase domain-containing protein [Reyranellaceae bacterium]